MFITFPILELCKKSYPIARWAFISDTLIPCWTSRFYKKNDCVHITKNNLFLYEQNYKYANLFNIDKDIFYHEYEAFVYKVKLKIHKRSQIGIECYCPMNADKKIFINKERKEFYEY